MSDNNDTANIITSLPSAHLMGRAKALASLAIEAGLRSREEGQMHVDNMIAFLRLQGVKE